MCVALILNFKCKPIKALKTKPKGLVLIALQDKLFIKILLGLGLLGLLGNKSFYYLVVLVVLVRFLKALKLCFRALKTVTRSPSSPKSIFIKLLSCL